MHPAVLSRLNLGLSSVARVGQKTEAPAQGWGLQSFLRQNYPKPCFAPFGTDNDRPPGTGTLYIATQALGAWLRSACPSGTKELRNKLVLMGLNPGLSFLDPVGRSSGAANIQGL
jgi:hypothetical protein